MMKTEITGGELPLYEIKIKGHVDSKWQDWFESLTITPSSDGNTILRGLLADQAALHGVLKKIYNLGMTLISVNQILQE